MRYELIVIWETGERDSHMYADRDAAEKAMSGLRMAFGDQIQWMGINRKAS